MYEHSAYRCVYVHGTHLGAHIGRKRVSASLELGLWVVVSHYVGAETELEPFLCKAASALTTEPSLWPLFMSISYQRKQL